MPKLFLQAMLLGTCMFFLGQISLANRDGKKVVVLKYNYSGELPNVKFYGAKDKKSPYSLTLDSHGLFFKNKNICLWPGGKFSQEAFLNKWTCQSIEILNGEGKTEKVYPSDLPLHQWVTEQGLGAIQTDIEISEIASDWAKAIVKGKAAYIFLPDLKDSFGWDDPLKVDKAAETKKNAEIDSFENEFKRYRADLKKCWEGGNKQGCIEKFVHFPLSIDLPSSSSEDYKNCHFESGRLDKKNFLKCYGDDIIVNVPFSCLFSKYDRQALSSRYFEDEKFSCTVGRSKDKRIILEAISPSGD